MIRINLLPHREARRREQRKNFFIAAALMVVLGVAVGIGGHLYIGAQVDAQERRNEFIRVEIRQLDRQIAEIRGLREQIDALLARKQVIESLQADRGQTVHLLNELVFRMPEGVHLRSLRQSGSRVTLVGHAQSNARVSHLMRNLEASPHLGQPGLVEVKSVIVDNRRLSEFTLNINVVRQVGESEEAL